MSFDTSSLSQNKGYILLEDGTIIEGVSFGSEKTVLAEIVFNTGMTGYQEILTDPSYARQAVVMTYPLIGNYGVNPEDIESSKIQVSALIVKEFCEKESNWKSNINISQYLHKEGIVGIYDLDTRMLTKKIRNQGAMNCLITTDKITDEHRQKLSEFQFPDDVVAMVSRKEQQHIEGAGKKIALVDLGTKTGIVNHFAKLNCEIDLLPWNVKPEQILGNGYDALMLSNGPGDPKTVEAAINLASNLVSKLPILGICLGHQITALALGADTYKLKFGHRGSNHPVIDLESGRVFITSQNHGYAVNKDSMPENFKLTHLNVNDNTVEGFSIPELDVYTVQFHPEAGPGPRDANFIFKEWVDLL